MRNEPHAGQRSIARPSSRKREGVSRLYHARARRSAAPAARSRRRDPATVPEEAIDPQQQARAAGLNYTTDHSPGIRRVGSAKRPRYLGPNGKPVREAATLARIKSLVIPPAWTDVWICTDAQGHLQATGRDARGRKQYRYHPKWRTVRDEHKFDRLAEFGAALPAIRDAVERDLAQPGLTRRK